MVIWADAIRPLWLKGIHLSSGVPKKQIKDLLNEPHPIQPTSQHAFGLLIYDEESLQNCYAGDVARFEIAAYESHPIINTHAGIIDKSLAWEIIRSYYSSFFAAHSILRILGNAIVRLDISTLSKLNQIGNSLYGPVFNIPQSNYVTSYDPTQNILFFDNLGSSNPHEILWKYFFNKIYNEIDKFVLTGNHSLNINDSQKISVQIQSLKSTCPYDNWLSTVRHEVNYQLKHDVWFPYGKKAIKRSDLQSIFLQWDKDPSSLQLFSRKKEPLKDHALITTFIISLCHAISNDLIARSSSGKSFISLTSRKLLKSLA